MAEIKRFFECLLPVTVCNIECPYCYIIQENRRHMKLADLTYSPEHIANALRQSRLGGTCLISICGAGETMAQKEIVDIVKNILDEGHYVNITTNGTLSTRFDDLIKACAQNINRLHVSFSMHYLELKKRGWIELFFDNIRKVKDAGGSFLLQLNLCDEYIPYIEEIQELCLAQVGAYPQIALTRNEKTTPMSIMTERSEEEYYTEGARFNSPLFDFTTKNFMVKRKEFCYAGEWSGVLNLQSGELRKCYGSDIVANIFEDIEKPIPFEAVGNKCSNPYCINSSHFMSLGIIPSISTPSYGQLRNRKEAAWYNEDMENFLNSRLYNNNSEYSPVQKKRLFRKYTIRHIKRKLSQYRFYQLLYKLKENIK